MTQHPKTDRQLEMHPLVHGSGVFDPAIVSTHQIRQNLLHQVFGRRGARRHQNSADVVKPRVIDFGYVVDQVSAGAGVFRDFRQAQRVRAVA